MALLVDTSVWSLLFRRERPPEVPELGALRSALRGDESVVTTGVVVLELLYGIVSETVATELGARLRALPLLTPTFDDHAHAAMLRTHLRSRGVQIGPIDALLAQIAIAGDHTLLTTDADFRHAAAHVPLRVWNP